ncbi:hypothetical protein M407DRAFT_24405 [Tulasnella calospora MUT 4182]|uniref:Protein kinase domain-containing protein n=1 Tax=Tulasnella calospora MUT 4182 TaxID=1051891 RepID=A0A0C3QJG8_9AGAM|nr:hypothetical protein M407DRAFT_24405 [Tulasnella calospora MUT 4182]
MSDHATTQKQENQLAPVTPGQSARAARISPRKVLESLSALRIEATRIQPLEIKDLGRGGNADVVPAKLVPAAVPEPSTSSDAEYVAVKKLNVDGDTNDIRGLALLAHEVYLLNDLSHDNVIKLIGFAEDIEGGIAWIVLPWEKNGNLQEFIASANWEFPERIALIYDVANGIEYLHNREPPICHGDLKSLNVLVNSVNKAVLTDFGSARSVESASGKVASSRASSVQDVLHPNMDSPKVQVTASEGTITLTGAQWTLRWAAPELLAGGLPDPASDVMTSNFPFQEKSDVSVVIQIIQGKLPSIHGDGRIDQAVALANLMTDCWSLDPGQRPTAKLCERQVYWMDRITPCGQNGSESSTIRSARLLTSIAEMHLAHRRLDEAMDVLHQAMNIACSTKDQSGTPVHVYRLGQVYYLRGELSEAEQCFRAAGDMYAAVRNLSGLAAAFRALGEVYGTRGQSSKAEQSLITARDIYTRMGPQVSLADVTGSLGALYRLRGEYSKAEELFAVARDIYDRVGYQRGLGNTVYGLGNVYVLRGEYSKAEESLVASRDIYARVGDQEGAANAIFLLGDVYRLRGEYSKAEEFYIDARDIYTRIGDSHGIAYAVYGLADVYRLRSEYSAAEESYVTARDMYARLGLGHGFANAVRALGSVYDARGESLKAKAFYFTACDIYTRIGNRVGLAHALKALGDVYRLGGEYSTAEEFYVAARDIYSEIGDQLGLANSITGLGRLSFQLNMYNQAEKLYQEARGIYATIGSKYPLANILWYTGWLCQTQRRYEEAKNAIFEALTLYEEIGVEKDVLECKEFLETIRKTNSKS